MNPKEDVFEGYKHMMVDVDDVEDENLLQHFKATNAFIEEGENGGGGVLVHWYVIITIFTSTESDMSFLSAHPCYPCMRPADLMFLCY